MKLSRRQLRSLIMETLLIESAKNINVEVTSGNLDDAKLTKLNSSFGQARNVTPGRGESLEFTVTKDSVEGPEKSKKHVDAIRRRLVAYKHIPDGVTLKVTYSN